MLSLFIYLDYHATTPVDPRVAEKVMALMTTQFVNASSVDHSIGDRARGAVDQAKQAVVYQSFNRKLTS